MMTEKEIKKAIKDLKQIEESVKTVINNIDFEEGLHKNRWYIKKSLESLGSASGYIEESRQYLEYK